VRDTSVLRISEETQVGADGEVKTDKWVYDCWVAERNPVTGEFTVSIQMREKQVHPPTRGSGASLKPETSYVLISAHLSTELQLSSC
jgi:hypothetical protein